MRRVDGQPIIRMSNEIIENDTPGEMILEKILEEDGNYDERQQREFLSHEHEHDKKHLLGNGHTVTVHVTRI